MIHIRNTQRTIKIDIAQFQKDAQMLLKILKYDDFDLGIWITTNATIQKYNRDYRNKDKPTDILSFPYHDTLKGGQRIKVNQPEDENLGDLIISAAYVTNDTKQFGVTFEHRMRRLLTHGICHLLGYDHIKDSEYKIMLAKERELLEAAFGKKEAAQILIGEIDE
jgi:probable rRNA maturation factor